MHASQADPVAMAALQEKLKGKEAELALISEKLGSAEYERNEAAKTLKEMEAKVENLNEVSPPGGAGCSCRVVMLRLWKYNVCL